MFVSVVTTREDAHQSYMHHSGHSDIDEEVWPLQDQVLVAVQRVQLGGLVHACRGP